MKEDTEPQRRRILNDRHRWQLLVQEATILHDYSILRVLQVTGQMYGPALIW